MKANSTDKLSSYLDTASLCQHAFTIEQLTELADSGIDHHTLQSGLKSDPRFVALDDTFCHDTHFVAKEALFAWFSKLSVRLVKAHLSRLSEQQLARSMSFLFLNTNWNAPPAEAIQFGQRFGFVGPAWTRGEYVFPMGHLLSFVLQPVTKDTCATLQNLYQMQLCGKSPDDLFWESVHKGFSGFSSRLTHVIQAREGFSTGSKMTLEQIGGDLGVGRERVRQLEAKFWKKVQLPGKRQPFVQALLCDVMRNQGSLVVKIGSPDAHARIFIAECLGIPHARSSRTGLTIIGASPKDLPAAEPTGSAFADTNVSTVATHLESSWHPCIIDSDVRTLAENIAKHHRKRLTRGQKLYLTLKAIGKPAHSTTIAEVYNSFFPDSRSTEHNLHAVLNREEYGIVWIGVHSTFALKEWGYEHPSATLFDTVTEIVERKFSETNEPVPFNVIIAEIGKYRRIVRPASLTIASHCNPNLRRVSKDSFVPKGPTEQIQEEVSADQLNKILEEFEFGVASDVEHVAKDERREYGVQHAEGSDDRVAASELPATTDTKEPDEPVPQTPIPPQGSVQQSARREPKPASGIKRVTESDIYNYLPEFFFGLAHWAKEKDQLNPWERRLTFDIGRYIVQGWLLSEKQERHGLRIIEKAKGLGFAEGETLDR